ncbi:hypothetical protein BX616_011175 [Lobosporangium transversale]|uniref:FAD-binding domain-containing protein n=1 Tax=Lobosporangium transversale TaxID=64571 RepID=A0A1Y2H4I9_9FUNG|nr:hypothetical protein BCR41DRAFT_392420 [Lobosporangium transversale]KAF9917823.1 hypothetical protein BX616_011175 [Lobosporangium transversale]ORZ27962.1 hypothetical protein BCR41DRAFT_392420 [Lobosporangium transversale]|eukprot:XP_021885665.1 hypothetical protein BCR41DRAFT_392420 [Lobosporangium transversale]
MNTRTNPPNVMIVGGGIAGLFLGTLLERANIPYTIFERATTVKTLGAILALNVNILPVFEQLGLFDELKKISFSIPGMHLYNEDMTKIRYKEGKAFVDKVGYQTFVFSRPEFYNLLLAQVPSHKILFGKKVLSIEHPAEGGVIIHCSDNSSYLGDIIVGADGAYSGVRQSLYKYLRQQNLLPISDTLGFKIGYMTMVGTTDPLDNEKIPDLKDNYTHFRFVFGKGKPYTSSAADDMAFRTSEWGPEGNDDLIKEVYNFPTSYGPLGQIVDATPRNRISKVFLEEKLFETWYHGRTVLIGDAAHKMSPSRGQGAVNALQDAVILANCLYEIADCATPQNITAAFQDYKEQRHPYVEFQFKSSKMQGKIMFGQKWSDRLLRQLIMGYMPTSFLNRDGLKAAGYRPQCTFLPLAPQRGTCTILPQKSSRRYAAEQTKESERLHGDIAIQK